MKIKVLNTINKYKMLGEGDKVVVALSGGADSTALLLVLKELKFDVCAVHVNHMLRGNDSNRDELFCKNLCEKLGVPFISVKADVKKFSKENSLSLETAAREVRYAEFSKAKEYFGAFKVATAHSCNDNAETMLMNLARGASLSGLCGIPPVRDFYIRPLIIVTREEIEKYLKLHSQDFVTDETNFKLFCTRNKIRHNVIPCIENNISKAFVKNASSAAALLLNDKEYLDCVAEKEYNNCSDEKGGLDCKKLLKLHISITSRIISIFIYKNTGKSAEQTHINSVIGILSKNTSKKIDLFDIGFAVNRYGKLVFENESVKTEFYKKLQFGENIIDGTNIIINVSKDKINNSLKYALLSCDKLNFNNLIARSREASDKIVLKAGTKSIKKLFIDKKIPQNERHLVPILENDGEVAAAIGVCVADKYKPSKTSEKIYITIL